MSTGKTPALARHEHWQDMSTGKTSALARHEHWQDISTGKTSALARHGHLKMNLLSPSSIKYQVSKKCARSKRL